MSWLEEGGLGLAQQCFTVFLLFFRICHLLRDLWDCRVSAGCALENLRCGWPTRVLFVYFLNMLCCFFHTMFFSLLGSRDGPLVKKCTCKVSLGFLLYHWCSSHFPVLLFSAPHPPYLLFTRAPFIYLWQPRNWGPWPQQVLTPVYPGFCCSLRLRDQVLCKCSLTPLTIPRPRPKVLLLATQILKSSTKPYTSALTHSVVIPRGKNGKKWGLFHNVYFCQAIPPCPDSIKLLCKYYTVCLRLNRCDTSHGATGNMIKRLVSLLDALWRQQHKRSTVKVHTVQCRLQFPHTQGTLLWDSWILCCHVGPRASRKLDYRIWASREADRRPLAETHGAFGRWHLVAVVWML